MFLSALKNVAIGRCSESLVKQGINLNDPAVIQSVNETYEMGNTLRVIIINKGNVLAAEGKGGTSMPLTGTPSIEILISRATTAFSLIHEFIAHALEIAIVQDDYKNQDSKKEIPENSRVLCRT